MLCSCFVNSHTGYCVSFIQWRSVITLLLLRLPVSWSNFQTILKLPCEVCKLLSCSWSAVRETLQFYYSSGQMCLFSLRSPSGTYLDNTINFIFQFFIEQDQQLFAYFLEHVSKDIKLHCCPERVHSSPLIKEQSLYNFPIIL